MNKTGIFKPLIKLIVPSELWYGALSRSMTVLSHQSAFSLSNLSTNFLKNISMTLLLELDWIRDKYNSPFVSIPTNIVIRGMIFSFGIEFIEFFGLHFIRLKSLMPNHVWSTLMTRLPLSKTSIRCYANYYLKTRLRSELVLRVIAFIFL